MQHPCLKDLQQAVVVGGQQDGGVVLLRQVAEEVEHFAGGCGIEVAGDLVGDEEGGAVEESAGEGDALAFAAAEGVGLEGARARQADGGENFLGAFLPGLPLLPPRGAENEI